MIVPFLAGFVDRSTERLEETLPTNVHMFYSEITLSLTNDEVNER